MTTVTWTQLSNEYRANESGDSRDSGESGDFGEFGDSGNYGVSDDLVNLCENIIFTAYVGSFVLYDDMI